MAAAQKEANIFALLDAAERATNPVVGLAEQAKKYYIESVQKQLKDEDFSPYGIDLDYLDEYIPNSKHLDHFMTDNGYCKYKQHLIIAVNNEKVTHYVIFSYDCSGYSFYDADRQFNNNLSGLPKDEAIKLIADNLARKIRLGTAYNSLQELVVAQRNDKMLYQKLKDKFCPELEDAKETTEADPGPSVAIQELIEKGEPATLREILIAKEMNSISTEDAKEIGKILSDKLPSKHRKKVKVVRDGKNMEVTQYEPDDFGLIETVIWDWMAR